MAYNKRQGLGLPFLHANIGRALIEIKGSLFEDSDTFNTGDVRPQNLFGSLFEDTDTFRDAVVDAPAPGNQSIIRNTFLNSSSLFHGIVRPTNMFGSLLEDSDTLNDGEIGGSRQLEGHDHNNESIFYHGRILLDLQELDGELFSDSDTLHHGALSFGEINIQGSKLGKSLQVLDTATSTNAAMTEHIVDLPNRSHVIGRLVLVCIATDGTPSFSWPTGWTELFDSSASLVALSVGYRVIDGTEGFDGSGDQITVETTTSEPSTAVSYLIENFVDIWNLDSFSYSGNNTVITPQLTEAPIGIYFKPDGLKMFLVGVQFPWIVAQYTLSTAWDITTVSGSAGDFYTIENDGDTPTSDLYLTPDGLKMFLLDSDQENIYSYTLGTAWDVTTASYDSASFNFLSQAADPWAFDFKPDGTKLYVGDRTTDAIYQYSVSPAFDITGVSYDSKSLSVGASTRGLRFFSGGTKLFVLDSNADTIESYSLSTAWDISTASSDGISLDISNEELASVGLYVEAEGQYLYITGPTDEVVYQYNGNSSAALEIRSTTGTSISPDPPSITPAVGYDNYLFIAVHAHDVGTTTTTGFPSTYKNNLSAVASGTGGVGIGASQLITPAETEDPGSFTISAFRNWIAATIAIRSSEIADEDDIFHGSMIPEIAATLLTDEDTFYHGSLYKGVRLTSSQRNYTAGHENPAAFVLDNAQDWVSVTIAIR